MTKTILRCAMFGLAIASMPALAQQVTPPASLNGGDRVSAQADATGAASVGSLLGEARDAARQGRLPLANEFVERAETLVLTRSTIAGTEGIPMRDGVVAKMADARAALARRDIGSATAFMSEAAGMAATMGL